MNEFDFYKKKSLDILWNLFQLMIESFLEAMH